MARTTPRPPKKEVLAEISEGITQSTALIASAVRMSGPLDYSKASKLGRDWQNLAWMFYDIVGEYRFACDWVGSMLSKAVLYPTLDKRDGEGPQRVTDGLPDELMDMLADGEEGQSDLLRAMGIHFTVAGECYLVGTTVDDEDYWNIYASTELSARSDKWYANGKEIKSDSDPLVIRMWMPHPKNPQMANSPSRAMLPILAEIDALTKHVAAQIDSRLAGAGILWVPTEMSFPTQPVTHEDGTVSTTGTGVSAFMAMLQNVMSTAIQNREDASALVPITVSAPADQIGAVKHMQFWSELDRQAVELRNEAIRRLALGMDMPPEVLLGVADTNHWAAWAADESAIKAHTEPLLKIIARSLAAGYLRPLLRDAEQAVGGEPLDFPIRSYGIGADTSQMRLRPNRSKEALELYQNGELSAVALRRETGFSEDDAPDADEMRMWFTRKVASGSTTPELVEGALRALGVELPAVLTGVTPDETQDARPTPSLLEHPVQGPPDTEEAVRVARLEAAAEQMVYRALERAGNKMRTRFGKINGVSALDTYRYVKANPGNLDHYLEDAFTGVDRSAERLGVDADALRKSLDAYCRVLITERAEVDPATLSMYVALAQAVAA